MLRLPALLFLVLAILTGCSDVPEDTRPGQPVKHRQDAFKAILRAFEPMGMMLREDRFEADAFLGLANDLSARRDGPWPYFGPDTDYPPSRSKPAVWSQSEGFDVERVRFVAAVDALALAAQTRDKAQVERAYTEVHASCKSCHGDFRR